MRRSMALTKDKKMIEKIRNYVWSRYKKVKFKGLKNFDLSIITSNCVGAVIYHDLGMPFLSPTINLTIRMNDLVKFAENLNWYLEKEIVEIKGDYEYPTGMLEDIRINFVHFIRAADDRAWIWKLF